MSLGGGNTTTTTPDIPQWYQQAQQGNINRATQIANRPYQPYGGPRIADWTNDQQSAMTINRSQVGQSNASYNEAADYMRESAETMNGVGYLPARTQAPIDVQAASYDAPALAPAAGYTASGPASISAINAPQLGGAQTYEAAGPAAVSSVSAPALGDAQSYAAAMGTAGAADAQTGASAMGAYDNAWNSQVIDRAMGDIDRLEDRELSQARRRAGANSAFGGSRTAIMENEIGRRFDDARTDTITDLRRDGFNTAVQAGMADADRGTSVSQFNAGQESAMSGANADRSNDASRYAAQMGNDFALQGAQMDMSAQSTNASAENAASMAAAGWGNDASRYAAEMGNQFSMRDAEMDFNAQAANTGASNAASMDFAGRNDQAGQFGAASANDHARTQAGYDNQAAQFGASSANDMAALNAGYQADANNRNADALNLSHQMKANNTMEAMMANRANAMTAGQGLAGLEGERRAAAFEGVDRLFNMGERERQLQQQGMNMAYGDFNRQQQHMIDGLNLMIGATSGVPQGMFGQTTQGPDNTLGQIGSLASTGATIASMFSDRRLKRDVISMGGGLYEYSYLWDPKTRHVGVMADEVPARFRLTGMSGFEMVDYGLMAMEAA